ncbi:hypothetical protein GCM10008101_25930 [Lysobacter xinjiangensis]|uniref:Glyoxalase-like domain-containing protein n=1 Tax=Cognatilysobacter xinjiangensis TaxID=546892 RepID=A0ABQ3C6U4_9GAMM|nr:hypothetical protein GCM10008101_25930 [Lysobacter xinjiangensis]
MAHRSRLAGFIIDCNTDDLDAAARFWSVALGASIDSNDASDETAEYRKFNDTPAGLHIEVQKVTHPSRVHLDIEADDIDAEAARLEALGAKKIAFVKRWWGDGGADGAAILRGADARGDGPVRAERMALRRLHAAATPA